MNIKHKQIRLLVTWLPLRAKRVQLHVEKPNFAYQSFERSCICSQGINILIVNFKNYVQVIIYFYFLITPKKKYTAIKLLVFNCLYLQSLFHPSWFSLYWTTHRNVFIYVKMPQPLPPKFQTFFLSLPIPYTPYDINYGNLILLF